jgi:hypothetical protein
LFNRYDCRKNVEDRFSIEKMIAGYESAYQVVTNNWEKFKSAKLTH